MGGIAMNFIQVGIPVIILEIKQEYLHKGLGIIENNWLRKVKKGKLSKIKFDKYMSLIQPTINYNDLSDV